MDRVKPFRALACALALSLAAGGAAAGGARGASSTLATEAGRLDRLSEAQGGEQVTSRFAADFASFAGSPENAAALITGLRTGTPITLFGMSTAESGSTATLTTITPPTAPMGYGNAYVVLSLARAQLAGYGITEPTPEQLKAALTGGSLTISGVGPDGSVNTRTVVLEGILTQRAAGMGWGEIAKANGFKLGPVVSAMKSAGHRPAGQAVTTAAGSGLAAETGSRAPRPAGHDITGRPHGRGITTALSGGGVVYGRDQVRPTRVAGAAGLRAADVSPGHGGGPAKGSGLARGAGHSGGTPGHHKAR